MLIIAHLLASIVCYSLNANISRNQAHNDGNNFIAIYIELPKGAVAPQTVEILALTLLGECTFQLLQYFQKAILRYTRSNGNEDDSAKDIGHRESCGCGGLLQNKFTKACFRASEGKDQNLEKEWEEYSGTSSEWASGPISEKDESGSHLETIEPSEIVSTTFRSFRTPLSPIYEDPAEEPSSTSYAQKHSGHTQRSKNKRKCAKLSRQH